MNHSPLLIPITKEEFEPLALAAKPCQVTENGNEGGRSFVIQLNEHRDIIMMVDNQGDCEYWSYDKSSVVSPPSKSNIMRVFDLLRFVLVWVLMMAHGVLRFVVWNVAPMALTVGAVWFAATCYIENGWGALNAVYLMGGAIGCLVGQFLIWCLLLGLCPADKRHHFDLKPV
jgi:hypothetical protein